MDLLNYVSLLVQMQLHIHYTHLEPNLAGAIEAVDVTRRTSHVDVEDLRQA